MRHQTWALRPLTLVFVCASVLLSMRLMSAPTTDPADQLRQVESFAIGGIGIAGTTSDGERALRNLLAGPDATSQLQGLLTKATPAGQLYALLGLRLHDRPAYERATKDFHAPGGDVETVGGCIITRVPVKQVLDRITAGQYDEALKKPVR